MTRTDRLLTPAEVAERLGVANGTLQEWRKTRRQDGPPFIRVSHRIVRYPERALEEWLAGR